MSMSEIDKKKKKDEELINGLTKLGSQKIDIWRYFSDRADKFAEQLWTTGTWLFGIISAVLALPFVAKFIITDPTDPIHLVQVKSRPLTFGISLFGLLLCGYAYSALTDIREHIKVNWRRAKFILTGEWKEASWSGRKLHGWFVLMVFEFLAVVAFAVLAITALIK